MHHSHQNQHIEILKQKSGNCNSISTGSQTFIQPDVNQIQSNLFEIRNSLKIYRTHIFQSKTGIKKLNTKINRSAVSWIQTNCWIKNFDMDTTILSVILYYAYCSGYAVDRNKLELLLPATMFVAKKYLSRPAMELENMMAMISTQFSKEEFLQIEIQIFELLQFDLHFDHNLHQLDKKSLSSEQEHRCRFLIELLLLQNHNILFDINLLQKVIQLSKNTNPQTILPQISQLLQKKQSQSLINKYNSYTQINKFVNQIQYYSMTNQHLKRYSE